MNAIEQAKQAMEEMTSLVKQRYSEDDPDVWHEVLKAESALAALSSVDAQPERAAPGVPEGWQLVPKKMTRQMIDAHAPMDRDDRKRIEHDWSVSLQNAPASPSLATERDAVDASPQLPMDAAIGFLRASEDFAKAHIACDEMEARDEESEDYVTDHEYETTTAKYNETKAAMLKAYRDAIAAIAQKENGK